MKRVQKLRPGLNLRGQHFLFCQFDTFYDHHNDITAVKYSDDNRHDGIIQMESEKGEFDHRVAYEEYESVGKDGDCPKLCRAQIDIGDPEGPTDVSVNVNQD